MYTLFQAAWSVDVAVQRISGFSVVVTPGQGTVRTFPLEMIVYLIRPLTTATVTGTGVRLGEVYGASICATFDSMAVLSTARSPWISSWTGFFPPMPS